MKKFVRFLAKRIVICRKKCRLLTGNKKYLRLFKISIFLVVGLGLLYLLKGYFVAALVNGLPVSRFNVLSRLEKQGGAQILDGLITEKLIFQAGAKQNIRITEEQVNEEIGLIEEQLGKQEMDLETALSMQGQTRQDLAANIKIKLILEKLLGDKIAVTDAEIQEYFDSNKATLYKDNKLADVAANIRSLLGQQKLSEAYQDFLKELKEKASIKYFVSY